MADEISHGLIARDILKKYPIKFWGQKHYVYGSDEGKNGYVLVGHQILKKDIQKIFNNLRERTNAAQEIRTSFINEVIAYIEREGYITDQEINSDLIYVNNGILDTANCELIENTPDIFVPIRIPVTFDPNAKCPAIDAFLRDITTDKSGKTKYDENDLLTLYEMFGYLLDPGYSIRKACMLTGGGHNGKCLKKGSLILTDKGIVKIEDLVYGHTDIENKYRKEDISQTDLLEHFGDVLEENDGERVYSDNIKNVKNVVSLSPKLKYDTYGILGKYDNGESDVITIRSNLGFEIVGTPEHRVVVINKDGNLTFKKLENIMVGDYIALAYNTQIYNDKLRLGFCYRKSVGSRYVKTLENVGYMNEEIARLLGYVISEANADFNNLEDACHFFITTYDKDMQDDIISICNKIGMDCSYRYDKRKNEDSDNIVGIRISSVAFADFMYYLGYRHMAQNKEVPWSILQADKNSQVAFLKALFDGDGYIGMTGVTRNIVLEYNSSSKELCRQLQIMMMNMGMVGNMSTKKGVKLEYKGEIREYEESYRLTFYGDDILNYAKLVGFGLSRKKEVLEDCVRILEDTERRSHMITPFISGKLRILYDRLILLGRMKGLTIDSGERIRFVTAKDYLKYHKCGLGRYCTEDNKERPSKLTLRRFLDILKPVKEKNFDNNKNIDDIYSYLEKINELFIFDRIEEIDKGKENVYDVTIENVHSYIGNCMINHNTTYYNVMTDFCGKNNISRVSLYDFSNRFASSELHNKLVNIKPDLGHDKLNGHARGMLKELTGGEREIMAEKKRRDHFYFFNRAKMYFGANEPPSVKTIDRAFIERWVIIELNNEYPDNPKFLQSLTTQEELSGLLNRALEALKRLRQQRCFSKAKSQGYRQLYDIFDKARIRDRRVVNSEDILKLPMSKG